MKYKTDLVKTTKNGTQKRECIVSLLEVSETGDSTLGVLDRGKQS